VSASNLFRRAFHHEMAEFGGTGDATLSKGHVARDCGPAVGPSPEEEISRHPRRREKPASSMSSPTRSAESGCVFSWLRQTVLQQRCECGTVSTLA